MSPSFNMWHMGSAQYLFLGNIQCVADDYKDWSPADNARGDCLMGRKIVYQRRIGHVLCYNGRSYIRPVSTRNCLCKVEDYEW